MAKTRLSPVLGDAERAEIARLMLSQVVQVVRQVELLAGILVISRDPYVLAMARELGVEALREDADSDLNRALTVASGVAFNKGADQILVLPADLPFITTQDVVRLLTNATGIAGIVIAPDDQRMGTNALVMPLPLPFAFQYGVDSFQRHLQAARRQRYEICVVESETLALDIDTPHDLSEYNTRIQHGIYSLTLKPFQPTSSHA